MQRNVPKDACKIDRSRQELSNEYFLSNLQTSASIQPRTSILKLRTPFNFQQPPGIEFSPTGRHLAAKVSLEAGLHRPALLYVLRRVLVRSSQVLHGRFLSWLHFPSAGAPAMRAPSSGTEHLRSARS